MKKQPKYELIKDDFIYKIENGIYSPGNELPSENELIQQYCVSRITVRRAIDELYHLGYVEKRQGKRGYVRETAKTQELASISSYTEEILKQGMVPSRKVIASELRLCTPDEQATLKLDKTDAVFHLNRVVYADNKPLCYTSTSLPYKFFRDIEQCDFSENSLYDVIENTYHIKIKTSTLKLKAILADYSIAQYLDIEQGMPLLYSFAATFGRIDGREQPIEQFTTYYLTDLFEYTLTQNR